MKTIDVKGKPYVEVSERLKYFREHYEGWALVSELVSDIEGKAIMKASVIDPEEKVIATGYAYEQEGNSFINKTSYIENCETSAWGRALGNLGIGIDAAVASADEVQNAIKNHDKPIDKKADEANLANLDKALSNAVKAEMLTAEKWDETLYIAKEKTGADLTRYCDKVLEHLARLGDK